MPTYLIIGASRGIGGGTAAHLAETGAEVLSVSRSPSSVGTWIEADVGSVKGIETVKAAVGNRPLDGLLFLGGVWEKGAFTDEYSFLDSPVEETLNMIAVNLTAPILLAQGLAKNLSDSESTDHPDGVDVGGSKHRLSGSRKYRRKIWAPRRRRSAQPFAPKTRDRDDAD